MKVALVTPWTTRQGGGVSEAARLMARLLAAEPGIEIEVLSVRDRGMHEELEDWGGVPIESFRYFGPGNYRFSPGLLWRVLQSDADLMHVHGIWTFQCLAVLLWSMLRRRPYLISPHGMLEEWILRRSRALKAIVQVLYHRAFLRRAAGFQVLTEKEARDVAPFVGRGVVRLIPNFVDAQPSDAGLPDWWTAEDEGHDIYLFFGRIHDKKGWRELCAGWDRACSEDAAFRDASRLVFCGWVDTAPDFETVVDEIGRRHGNVRFAGPQFGAGRSASLQAADVLVLPSFSEGQPMAVLEAWAASKPVMMTVACNLPLGFSRGAAIEISPTPESIGAGFRAFAGMAEAQRRDMGRAGRQLVDAEYSVASVRQRLLALYHELIARSSPAVSPRPAKGHRQ